LDRQGRRIASLEQKEEDQEQSIFVLSNEIFDLKMVVSRQNYDIEESKNRISLLEGQVDAAVEAIDDEVSQKLALMKRFCRLCNVSNQ
jgi:hypothetical protein